MATWYTRCNYYNGMGEPDESKIVGARRSPDGTLDTSKALRILETSETEESIPHEGVALLEERLKAVFSELSQEDRLAAWVKVQEEENKLKRLDVAASGSKTPLSINGQDDLILKRFDLGAEKLGFDEEKAEQAIAAATIPAKFLVATRYIELSDSAKPEQKYYVLQDKLQGIHSKTANSAALEKLGGMPEEERKQYEDDPRKWLKLLREILKGQMSLEQWEKARIEARGLVSAILQLEKTHKMDDVEFFITEEGVKLIDFQLHEASTYKPADDNFPEGAEYLRMLFDLERAGANATEEALEAATQKLKDAYSSGEKSN